MDDDQKEALYDLYFFYRLFGNNPQEQYQWRMALLGKIEEQDYADLVELGFAEEYTAHNLDEVRASITDDKSAGVLNNIETLAGRKVIRRFRITQAGRDHLEYVVGVPNWQREFFGDSTA